MAHAPPTSHSRLSRELYCGRLGNFSFATKHIDGTSDHAGVRTANHHDTLNNVLDHHFTGSGGGNRDRNGMDLTITKIIESSGVPDAVIFAADVVPHPTPTLADGTMSTSLYRAYGKLSAVAGYPDGYQVVVAVGQHAGDLTVPMNDGTSLMIPNPKFDESDYNGNCLMLTSSPIWPARAAQAASTEPCRSLGAAWGMIWR